MIKKSFILTLIVAASLIAGCTGPAPAETQPAPAITQAPAATQEPLPTEMPGEAQTTPTEGEAGEVPGEEMALENAQAYLDLLVEQDYAAAYERQGPQMKAAFSQEKMKETWEAVIAQVGAFQEVTATRSQVSAPYRVMILTTQFENALLDITITIDPQGLVEGLFFAESTASTSGEEVSSPEYARPDSFSEQEVVVGSGEWALPGTLTLPEGEGPFPAVVLVHGSGPNDRDETIGPNKPFRDLAWGLASQGIAVLRYEKRTRQYSQKMAAMADMITVQEETVEDALLAVDLLRQTEAIDPEQIYVLGHSLGGMLVPRIGMGDAEIAGFIVLAGSARPMEDSILEQYTYLANLDGTVTEAEQADLAEIREQVERVKDPDLSSETPAGELPLGIPASYWLDLRGYQPAEAARELDRPVLVLQGGRDYQVTEADFELWQAALEGVVDAEFKLYPALNHLFIEGEGQGSPAEYAQAGHVDEQVINDIAAWILNQAGRD